MSKKYKFLIIILLLAGALTTSLIFANSTGLQGLIFKFVPKISVTQQISATKIPKAQLDTKLLETLWKEASIETGTKCSDSIDNDKDNLFDCYDPDCKDYNGGWNYNCSEYANTKTYEGVGIHTIKPHDRIKFPNGLIAEAKGSMRTTKDNTLSTTFSLYYEKNGRKITDSRGRDSIVPLTNPNYPYTGEYTLNFVTPYMSIYGAYLYLNNTNPTEKTIEVEILDNCKEIYERCINEPIATEKFIDVCNHYACPFEAYNNDLDIQETDQFVVVYPKEDEYFANILVKYLPSCLNETAKYLGQSNLPKLNVFFNNSTHNEDHVIGATSTNTMQVQYNGINLRETLIIQYPYTSTDYSWENTSKACGATFFPLAHEMVHYFTYGSLIPQSTYEGFANYIAFKTNKPQSYKICEEDGYRNSGTTEITPYSSTTDTYIAGNCFWELMEKEFGMEKIQKILEKIDSYRNISRIAPQKPYSILNDIFVPVLGKNSIDRIKEISDKFGGTIEIDCDSYIGGFDGSGSSSVHEECN